MKVMQHLATARRFAVALDAENYATARMTLAEACLYHIHDDVVRGRNAIVDSYRKQGLAARDRFDEVAYASVVEPSGARTAVITFVDRVRLGEAWHEFRCRQHVTVGAGGLIEEIRHEELPDERERLAEFESRAERRPE